MTQSPEDDTQVHIVDDTTQQLPVTVTPDTPIDSQIAETVPVAEDAVLEPAPSADVVEISEELTTVDISEASKPAPETAQMDVEESVIPQEPEDKTDAKSQQREGMHSSSQYPAPLLTLSLLKRQTQDYRLGQP